MYEHPSLKNIPKKTSFFSYVELNSTENYFSKFIFLFISLKRCMGLQKGRGCVDMQNVRDLNVDNVKGQFNNFIKHYYGLAGVQVL